MLGDLPQSFEDFGPKRSLHPPTAPAKTAQNLWSQHGQGARLLLNRHAIAQSTGIFVLDTISVCMIGHPTPFVSCRRRAWGHSTYPHPRSRKRKLPADPLQTWGGLRGSCLRGRERRSPGRRPGSAMAVARLPVELARSESGVPAWVPVKPPWIDWTNL